MPSSPTASASGRQLSQSPTESASYSAHDTRNERIGHSDLSSLLGIVSTTERDQAGLENRRETKQERETRRLQREKVTREREREQSMRKENVDGGFLVTQGVYTGTEDYSKHIVRQLMVSLTGNRGTYS